MTVHKIKAQVTLSSTTLEYRACNLLRTVTDIEVAPIHATTFSPEGAQVIKSCASYPFLFGFLPPTKFVSSYSTYKPSPHKCLSWILHSHTASKLSPFLFAACLLCPLLILTLCLWKLFLIDSCSIHHIHSLSFQCFQCQSGSGRHASACYLQAYLWFIILAREGAHPFSTLIMSYQYYLSGP